MTVVDTTVWIDYLGGTVNPHTDWLDRELNQQRLGLTDLILCEVLQGIRVDSDGESGGIYPDLRYSIREGRCWLLRRHRTIASFGRTAIPFGRLSTP